MLQNHCCFGTSFCDYLLTSVLHNYFMMDNYEKYAAAQMQIWRKEMISRPSLLNNLSKRIQTKVNAWIPEKVHLAITTAIKQMTLEAFYLGRNTLLQNHCRINRLKFVKRLSLKGSKTIKRLQQLKEG